MSTEGAFSQLLPSCTVLRCAQIRSRAEEFGAGRMAAAAALSELGCKQNEVSRGPSGEPIWPKQVVGSISHKESLAACAVALTGDLAAIGIDIEVNGPVRAAAIPRIASSDEVAAIGELARQNAAIHWDRLLFSAKESVAKALSPLAGALPARDQIAVVLESDGTFTAEVDGARDLSLGGRWTESSGLLLTAIAVAPLGIDRRGASR